jgi:hypothetical protein
MDGQVLSVHFLEKRKRSLSLQKKVTWSLKPMEVIPYFSPSKYIISGSKIKERPYFPRLIFIRYFFKKGIILFKLGDKDERIIIP